MKQEQLKQMGFRVNGIFDAEIDSAPMIQRSHEEKEQIRALVSKKKASTASGIYTNIGTMCVTSGAVLKAQRSQMENYARELLRGRSWDMLWTQRKSNSKEKN